MSSDLKNFCRAVLKNIELEEKERDDWFCESVGLCHNSNSYDKQNGTHVNNRLFGFFGKELYPFNNNSFHEYDREFLGNIMYENEKRLAFLREHAQLE